MEDRLRTPQDRGNYCYWRRHVDCLWLVASADVTACSRPSSLNGVPFLKGLFSTPSPSKPFQGQGLDEGVGTIGILPQTEWSHNNQTWPVCSSKCLRSKLGTFLGHQKCKNMICCSCRTFKLIFEGQWVWVSRHTLYPNYWPPLSLFRYRPC